MTKNGKISSKFFNSDTSTHSCTPYPYQEYYYNNSNNHIIIKVTNNNQNEEMYINK